MGWSGVVSWVGEWCHGLVSGVMGWSGVGSWVGEWCHGLVWSGVMD